VEIIQSCLLFYRNNVLLVSFGVVCVLNILTIIIAWRRIHWLNRLVEASDRLYGITALGLEQEKRDHERTKRALNEAKRRRF